VITTAAQGPRNVLIRMGELRSLVKEELAGGIPEWQLRQDTAQFVDLVKRRIASYAISNSGSPVDRREAMDAVADTCADLERDVYDLVDDRLFSFMRRF